MSKRLFQFVLLTFILLGPAVLAAPKTITQNFGVAGDPFMRIDERGVAEEINPRGDQGEEFDVTPTGFSWGGYIPPTGYRLEIDQNSRGGTTFDELVFKTTTDGVDNRGAYAYTIMASNGSNVADNFIDMTGVDASMMFRFSDIWHGYLGGGDNGSGLPYPGDQLRATVLRAMIRDANGDWFMSDLFCPLDQEYTAGELDGTLFDYTLYFADTQWRKLPADQTENLNYLTGGDEIAIDRDPNVTELPDLSYVSGFGVYIWNTYLINFNGWVAFNEISLSGQEPAIPEDVYLTQNFDKSQDNFYPIDGLDADPNFALAEVPQSPDFTTTQTGWTWGGYCPPEAFRTEIDRNTYTDYLSVIRIHDELAFKNVGEFDNPIGSLYGSYAYTIFDSTGGNQPDSSIDMTDLNAAMELKISDIWHGWFGGQSTDNGSGLPEPQDEQRATVLRAMIRDGAGNWYASDLFCPSTTEITSTSTPAGTDGALNGHIFEHRQSFNNMTWYQYSQAETDNLNALTGGDEIALSRDPLPAVVEPNLAEVTGMGVYIWSRWQTSSSKLGIKEVSLIGSSVTTPPEFWDAQELRDLASEWLKDSVAWTADMDTDPAASDEWVIRGGGTGDYLIAGGQMVILGNTGSWRLDTAPVQMVAGTTTANATMQATSVSADQTPANRTGINLWLKADVDETEGTLETNVNVVLEGDNTQYVELISGWTPGDDSLAGASFTRIDGDGITDFDTTALDIEISIVPDAAPATTGTLSYVISDQSGTTASGSFTLTRRTGQKVPTMHTIYSGGAQGVVDNVVLSSGYMSPYDRAGSDGLINYLDFEWLGERWLSERTELWP